MIAPPGRRWTIAVAAGTLAWLFVAAVPLSASSGAITDPSGELLEGVTVCFVVAGVEQLCVTTDRSGRWQLPASKVDTVRLTLDGFIKQTISGADHIEAIIMRPAATLLVQFVDAAGEPLGSGEFDLIYPSGKQVGPFPIARKPGTRIRSLEPGPVLVIARSEGFDSARAAAELITGEEAIIIVKLSPSDGEH